MHKTQPVQALYAVLKPVLKSASAAAALVVVKKNIIHAHIILVYGSGLLLPIITYKLWVCVRQKRAGRAGGWAAANHLPYLLFNSLLITTFCLVYWT